MSEGALPEGWALTSIDQVASNYSGNSKLIKGKLSSDPGEGLYPAFSASGQDVWHSEYGEEGPAIIVSAVGARCGKVFRASGKWSAIANTHVVRINAIGGDLDYFYYLLNREHYWVKGGSAQPFVRTKATFERPFPLPPLAEQKRIVSKIEELFSELDAGEESLRRARRQLGVYRQSLLKQAFEGKLTAPWRAQHPDLLESPDQLLARIQAERQARFLQQLKEWEKAVKEWEKLDTDEKRPPKPQKMVPSDDSIQVIGSDLPDGWITLNLSQFVLELGQGWSPKCENREATAEEWAVIKTTAIQFGSFDPKANKALPTHSPPRRWLGLNAGEILITRAGPRSRCGVVCRVHGEHPRLMLCDKAYRLVLSESATSSEFVERLLCSPLAMAAIEKLKTGINDSGVNITQSAFLQLALPLPSLPEQQEIVRLLDAQFEVIEQNEREIDAALKRSEALRQSILKKAFTGQLVPQDPADEPASALLERIRAEQSKEPGGKRAAGGVKKKGVRRA